MLQGKRVRVTYASPYLFIGPIAGWFGGTFHDGDPHRRGHHEN